MTTIAGGPSSNRDQINNANNVAIDSHGNVYAGDWTFHRIQKYTPGVPGWKQVNINGFGNPTTVMITSLEAFNNLLYAGTLNWVN